MKKFKKHIVFIYLSIFIVSTVFVANYFILPASNNLYKYVPADSDIVMEINAFNFVNEVGYQWIYEPSHFESKSPVEEDNISQNFKNTGINPLSKILIFKEKWANEALWFAVLEVNSKNDFKKYFQNSFPKAIVRFKDNIAIVQLNASNNQEEVTQHIKNIVSEKVKSIEANPIIKTEFSNDHEINVFLKSVKSDYVTDGYLNINFNASQIDISGYFHPIGKTDIQPIAYKSESNIGLSLRSSLNLLNTIYLFNDTKLDHLPDYKQIALDYDGVNLLTNNDVIPVTSFPNINLLLDIYDEKTWLKYLDAGVDDGNLLISDDTIMINSEVKAKVRYRIANEKFELFQQTKLFTKADDSTDTYFSLYIHPYQIIEKMNFREDKNNPPKLIATQIIKIVRSLLEDFSYLKAIEEVNFTIQKDQNSSNFLSNGHIVFQNQDSHSTIECYFLFQKFIQTFGNLLH